MPSWKRVIVSGSSAHLNQVTASGGFSGDGAGITGLTSAAIDTVAAMTNNYVLTATGATAVTGESNLQFDGTGLAVTGHVTASGNISASGYLYGDGSALTGITSGPFAQTGSYYSSDSDVQITGSLAISGVFSEQGYAIPTLIEKMVVDRLGGDGESPNFLNFVTITTIAGESIVA